MTGRPKLRAFLDELNRQKREQFEDDADQMSELEYVAQCVEGGESIIAIAKRVIRDAGVELYPSVLSTYLYKTFGDEAGVRLRAARKHSGHALLEIGADLIDSVNPRTASREELKHVEMQDANRRFRAGRYNPEELGERTQAQPQFSVGVMFLDSLRRHQSDLLPSAEVTAGAIGAVGTVGAVGAVREGP